MKLSSLSFLVFKECFDYRCILYVSLANGYDVSNVLGVICNAAERVLTGIVWLKSKAECVKLWLYYN